MKVISVVIFAILILACVGLILWRMILPMKDSAHKKILLACAIVGVVICELLLITSAMIPSKVDSMLTYGIGSAEEYFETISPGYPNKELSTAELKNVLENVDNVNHFLDEAPHAGLVVRLVGAGTYLGAINTFSKSIDTNLKEMEADGVPVTLHNVFIRIQEKSRPAVMKGAKVLEVLVIILSIVFILALLIVYYIVKKNEDDLKDPRIIMVEQPDSIPSAKAAKGE